MTGFAPPALVLACRCGGKLTLAGGPIERERQAFDDAHAVCRERAASTPPAEQDGTTPAVGTHRQPTPVTTGLGFTSPATTRRGRG